VGICAVFGALARSNSATALHTNENPLPHNVKSVGLLVCGCVIEKSINARDLAPRWIKTFHITFSLIDDEGVASTSAFFVANDSYAFDSAIAFKFAPEVGLCGRFMLVDMLHQYK
jgi:hypothetical protein